MADTRIPLNRKFLVQALNKNRADEVRKIFKYSDSIAVEDIKKAYTSLIKSHNTYGLVYSFETMIMFIEKYLNVKIRVNPKILQAYKSALVVIKEEHKKVLKIDIAKTKAAKSEKAKLDGDYKFWRDMYLLGSQDDMSVIIRTAERMIDKNNKRYNHLRVNIFGCYRFICSIDDDRDNQKKVIEYLRQNNYKSEIYCYDN